MLQKITVLFLCSVSFISPLFAGNLNNVKNDDQTHIIKKMKKEGIIKKISVKEVKESIRKNGKGTTYSEGWCGPICPDEDKMK